MARVPVGLLTLLLVVACSGEPPGSNAGQEGTGSTEPDTVPVFLGEYFIDMPDSLAAGVRTLEVTNEGMHVHDLWVRPEDGDSVLAAFSRPLDPGETRVLSLDLEPGRYYLNCQVANHEGRGMYQSILVTPETEP